MKSSIRNKDKKVIRKKVNPDKHSVYQGLMAGVAGFEPTNAAVKVLCLTA